MLAVPGACGTLQNRPYSMPRKTKEEALATRARLLDAAERLFAEQGVAGSSLHNVALAAGVTRGAVYHHFVDKADLFNAMMERVCLPMETSMDESRQAEDLQPLQALQGHLLDMLASVAADPQVQRVFEIAFYKVEYVGELVAVRERMLQMRRDHIALLEALLSRAQQRGDVAGTPPARQAAIGLHALLDGLIQTWMLDPQAFDLVKVGRQAVHTHLAGLTSTPQPAAAR